MSKHVVKKSIESEGVTSVSRRVDAHQLRKARRILIGNVDRDDVLESE